MCVEAFGNHLHKFVKINLSICTVLYFTDRKMDFIKIGLETKNIYPSLCVTKDSNKIYSNKIGNIFKKYKLKRTVTNERHFRFF